MNKVYACVEGQASTGPVVDCALWATRRLDVPLVFLHVMAPAPTHGPTSDLGTAAGLAAQEDPLEEITSQDERQARQDDELGRRLLGAACERATALGFMRHESCLRHGDLPAVAQDLEGDARLFVLAQHALEATSGVHWVQLLERLVRAVHRPVLVVPGQSFVAPERLVLAFDGSPTAQRAVEGVAASPLLQGLPVVVAMAAADRHAQQEALAAACERLRAAGFEVCGEMHPGVPQDVLPRVLSSHATSLLVMGAYGHSRLRQLLLGSTTATLLRSSKVPVLVLH
jgi:nucleotide-binding universal stress UspA family protein